MPPQAQGAYNSVKQALSVFSPFNKTSDSAQASQGTPALEDEYTSKLNDDTIIQLKNQWIRDYQQYFKDIEETQRVVYDYWIGRQTKNTVEDMLDASRMLADNKLFQALETFIPIATRANPDPLVTIDPSMVDQQLSDLVRAALVYQADKQKLRMLLKAMVRDWALFRLGVLKVGWDAEENDIVTKVVNPRRMVLDPTGYVKEGGVFTGEYVGEKMQMSVSRLITLFPAKRAYIEGLGGGRTGTKLDVYIWWYRGTDFFYTLNDTVLGKYKNHLWNYDGEQEVENEMGEPLTIPIQGINHWSKPMCPYIFLGIFTTRTQPHDDTSLFHQNLSIQDMINRRFRQIDKNVESMNNGIVVSGQFNSEQAALAAEAIRKGGAIRSPGEVHDVTKAVMRLPAPALSPDVFNSLVDARNELSNIFGTSGSTPDSVDEADTARGKILINQLDASRIGGGVTEYIEQVADTWFNAVLQIMYVHYDEPHYASALGTTGAQELVKLRSADLQGKILVTVKEGSMIPKDPMTLRNQAVDLWSANGIDPVTFGKYLDMPDPYSYAENLLKWQLIQKGALPPQVMFPDFPQAPLAAQPQVQPGTGGPAVNAPPAGPEMNAPAPPGSPGAVQEQGQQLLQTVPTK